MCVCSVVYDYSRVLDITNKYPWKTWSNSMHSPYASSRNIKKKKIIQKLLVARTAGEMIIRTPTIVLKQIVFLKFNCNSLLKEKFEWLFRSRKSNDRQCNDQKKKRTSSDLQNTTQKTKHWATQTALKIGGELRCSGRIGRFCYTCSTRRVTLWTNPVIRMREGPDCDYDD